MLNLIAINGNETIESSCAINTNYKELLFFYKSKSRKIKYYSTARGNYFILKGLRWYFNIFDNYEEKWLVID